VHLSRDILTRCSTNGLSAAEQDEVTAHLIECSACREKLAELEAGVSPMPIGTPPEPQTAFIKFLDPVTSIGPPHEVQLLSWTENEVTIASRRMVLPNTVIQLRYKKNHWMAKVSSCVEAEGGFQASLKIIRDFPA
jgi:hypothetical protein